VRRGDERTSMGRVLLPPTRRTAFSSSTRKSFTCVRRRQLARPLVEEHGASRGRLEQPVRASLAPVKAPFSCPNSSLSSSVSANAPQLSAEYGFLARGERS